MTHFKFGLAAVLAFLTALVSVFANADYFVAVGGNLGLIAELFCLSLAAIAAYPCWLVAITLWRKLHQSSYAQFKKWCFTTVNELSRP